MTTHVHTSSLQQTDFSQVLIPQKNSKVQLQAGKLRVLVTGEQGVSTDDKQIWTQGSVVSEYNFSKQAPDF